MLAIRNFINYQLGIEKPKDQNTLIEQSAVA